MFTRLAQLSTQLAGSAAIASSTVKTSCGVSVYRKLRDEATGPGCKILPGLLIRNDNLVATTSQDNRPCNKPVTTL